jgi:hypothetical protein
LDEVLARTYGSRKRESRRVTASLEGDVAPVAEVPGQVDRRHAAFAHQPLDGVPALEGGIELR